MASCPICTSEGYANIGLMKTSHAQNGFSYRRYLCLRCNTHFTVMFPSPKNDDAEYKKLLAARCKIQAIKNRRMLTGEGLFEAKRYMDNLELQMIENGELEGSRDHKERLANAIHYADRRLR